MPSPDAGIMCPPTDSSLPAWSFGMPLMTGLNFCRLSHKRPYVFPGWCWGGRWTWEVVRCYLVRWWWPSLKKRGWQQFKGGRPTLMLVDSYLLAVSTTFESCVFVQCSGLACSIRGHPHCLAYHPAPPLTTISGPARPTTGTHNRVLGAQIDEDCQSSRMKVRYVWQCVYTHVVGCPGAGWMTHLPVLWGWLWQGQLRPPKLT